MHPPNRLLAWAPHVACLIALPCLAPTPAAAQPPASGAAADSEAVFLMAADYVLAAAKGASIRLGRLPQTRWAEPGLARLRARATADTALEAVSVSSPRFAGDTARVTVSYVRCHPSGFYGGAEYGYEFVRVDGGWHPTLGLTVTHQDGTCTRRPAPEQPG